MNFCYLAKIWGFVSEESKFDCSVVPKQNLICNIDAWSCVCARAYAGVCVFACVCMCSVHTSKIWFALYIYIYIYMIVCMYAYACMCVYVECTYVMWVYAYIYICMPQTYNQCVVWAFFSQFACGTAMSENELRLHMTDWGFRVGSHTFILHGASSRC